MDNERFAELIESINAFREAVERLTYEIAEFRLVWEMTNGE